MLKRKKMRIVALGLSVLLATSGLAACNSGDDQDETTTTTKTTTTTTEAPTEVEDDGSDDADDTTEDVTEDAETDEADVTEDVDDTDDADVTEDVDDSEDADDDDDEEEEEVFEARDLGGATIVALNINSLAATNPDIEDDEMEDFEREERREYLDHIQEKYNVTIEYNDPPDVEWHEVGNEMVKAYTAGDPYADIMDFSFLYLFSLVNNNAVNDNTEWIFDLPFRDRYVDTATWQGHNYGVATFVGGEGLLYNREMIKDAGMEMEPNEMFATGQWSYDDFYDYLMELKANLPEDTYPFFIDPYYWFLYAPAGNGTSLITDDGVNYQDDAVIESLEFLDKIYDAGLVRDPNYNDEGQPLYWGTPGETFENGVEVAMTHRASWQAAELVDRLDFGFVPYPWGNNVTVENVGEEDAYLTLSDNYAVSAHDAQTKSMINGIEEKGNPEDIFIMFMDLINHDFMVTEYYEMQEGSDDTDEEVDPRYFSTELDAELFEWSMKQERMELYSPLSPLFELAGDYYDVFLEDASVRGVIDAAYPVDQATMVDEGFIEE